MGGCLEAFAAFNAVAADSICGFSGGWPTGGPLINICPNPCFGHFRLNVSKRAQPFRR